VRADFCKEIVMMAGSSEMDVNEFTVAPCLCPSCTAVTTVTPADQARMAARNFSGSRVGFIYFHDNGQRGQSQDKNSHLNIEPSPTP
jgi:hypothetical protein